MWNAKQKDIVAPETAQPSEQSEQSEQHVNPTFTKLLTNATTTPAFSATSVALATIDHFDASGQVWIDLPSFAAAPLPALTTCQLLPEHVGQQCAVQFIMGNTAQPLIIGLLMNQGNSTLPQREATVLSDGDATPETLTIQAKKEIILECGESYIRLTDEGVVEIRGVYISSDAAATHRLRGGSVLVN